jgi:eukaryotic-like serine/threonine-protein kinase
VRTALDRAAAGIAGKFEAQPLVEASIRRTIGKTYEDLGLYPKAPRDSVVALPEPDEALNRDGDR